MVARAVVVRNERVRFPPSTLKMKTESVKGFRDLTGEEAFKKEEIRKALIETFNKYDFEPAETPEIEYEEFVRGNNEQDETVSDIFKLKDKGKRNLALRYEFTFQLKRLAKNKKLPYKRYQIGSVFRDEPASANRFRQFTQADADIVGSSVKDEAEILALVKDTLNKLGTKFTIYFNNRKLLNEILNKEKIKNTFQIIKELDKLDKLSEKEVRNNLKKYGAERILNIIKKPENFFKKYESYGEIQELKKYCKFYGFKIEFLPSLARGLSYYKGSVFEIKTPNFKETICAGGSYEINGVQSTGISFGIDRILQLVEVKNGMKKTLIVSLSQDKEGIRIARKLRGEGKNVAIYYGKPSKALEYANSYGFQEVVFVGEEEVSNGRFKVKNMNTGEENFLEIN